MSFRAVQVAGRVYTMQPGQTLLIKAPAGTVFADLPLPPASPAIRNLAVFCASASGVHPGYRAAAEELGRALASHGIGLIYGGARVGLMHAVASSALAAGGIVVGVIPEVLVDLEVADRTITELHVVDTMHTRKALMGSRADAFLILPGGYGTFEELFEVLAWQTLKLHTKPIVLLNTNGFYDSMLGFLDHCVAEGMITPAKRSILLVADSVPAAFALLSIPAPPSRP